MGNQLETEPRATVTQVTEVFNYGDLGTDDALWFHLTAERIRERMKRSAEDIVLIGRDLQEAHDKLAHKGNGKFQAWIRSEFGMSRDTAENFVNVARAFGDSLGNNSLNSPTVLYLLAEPRHADVREAVVQQIEAGEVAPKVKDVQAAIAAAKAEGKDVDNALGRAYGNWSKEPVLKTRTERSLSTPTDTEMQAAIAAAKAEAAAAAKAETERTYQEQLQQATGLQ